MKPRTKIIVALIMLGLVDIIIPVPIIGIILLYTVLEKPAWFRDAVQEIYREK